MRAKKNQTGCKILPGQYFCCCPLVMPIWHWSLQVARVFFALFRVLFSHLIIFVIQKTVCCQSWNSVFATHRSILQHCIAFCCCSIIAFFFATLQHCPLSLTQSVASPLTQLNWLALDVYELHSLWLRIKSLPTSSRSSLLWQGSTSQEYLRHFFFFWLWRFFAVLADTAA